jgi:DNA polymerase-3 subunit gamma/tau
MAERRRAAEPDERPAQPALPLHLKHRPASLKEVVGQKEVVASLSAALKTKDRNHAYLFMGPAGTGKTTLARIVADAMEVAPQSILEVNAAVATGVDDMRALTAGLMYQGFGDNPNKAIIIDECHRLSKNAWDSLLKDTEEPPEHVFWFFCTSEGDKVPVTMARRCLSYSLKPVRHDDLMDLLDDVVERDGLDVSEKVVSMVAQAANGSPGMALSMLAKVRDCRDTEEAAVLLEQPGENAEVIDLCRLLVRGDLTWSRLTETLRKVDAPAESIRIVVVNYLSSCLMGAKSDRDAKRLLDMLAPFLRPCNASDKLGPILDAFGRYIFP